MQTSALETFVMVSRVGSFSRAAALRNMTLSALSMQMKGLEEELGAQLFDRRFRPPRLTPLGEQTAQDALSVLEAEAAMRRRCSAQDELTGTIQMGFVPSTAVRILPGFLKTASEMAPRAAFHLSSGLSENLSEAVRRGQLDAALVTDIPDATQDLRTDPLAQEEMVIAAPATEGAPEVRELSKRLRFIHFMPSSGIGRLIAQYCREMQLETRDAIVLDSIEAIVHCVRNGLGYSLLPRPDVMRYGGARVNHMGCAPVPLFRQLSLVTREDALSELWRPHLAAILRRCLPADRPGAAV